MNKIEEFIKKKFEEDKNEKRYIVSILYNDGDHQLRNIDDFFEMAGMIYINEPVKHIEIRDLESRNKKSWWSDDRNDLDEFLDLLNETYREYCNRCLK
jgi:hypothetical protein